MTPTTTRRHHARDPPGSGAPRPLLRVLLFPWTVSGLPVTGGLPRGLGACQLCALRRGEVVAHRTRSGSESLEVRDRSGRKASLAGRPPCCRRVSSSAPALMRHREKMHCSPNVLKVERSADVPGPKSGVHGLYCQSGREYKHQSRAVLSSAFPLVTISTWVSTTIRSGSST